uniref:Uncharacterized protein n=1 Tax=Romanomermis culicivorax TaxID=13658 RepID=A0A915HU80_ROMCU
MPQNGQSTDIKQRGQKRGMTRYRYKPITAAHECYQVHYHYRDKCIFLIIGQEQYLAIITPEKTFHNRKYCTMKATLVVSSHACVLTRSILTERIDTLKNVRAQALA